MGLTARAVVVLDGQDNCVVQRAGERNHHRGGLRRGAGCVEIIKAGERRFGYHKRRRKAPFFILSPSAPPLRLLRPYSRSLLAMAAWETPRRFASCGCWDRCDTDASAPSARNAC